VNATIADMPDTMREVFLLIRRDARSYKDAARRLGITVGTVHTHLSRATARLRDAVQRYRADGEALDETPRTTSLTRSHHDG
jgi:DNA-directed RNA polymerase specialized sigma24 family protein